MVKTTLFGITIITIMISWNMARAQSQTAEVQKIPQRSDINDKYKWRLQDIYADTLKWENDFNRLQSEMGVIEQCQGKLDQSAENLFKCLTLRDSLDNLMDRLYVFAFLKKDEDTRISQFQELANRVSALRASYSEIKSFIEPEILAIPADKLENFLNGDKNLAIYKFYVDNTIRMKPHILSAPEESILALARLATRGPSNIFDMIDNADIKFAKVKDEKGNEIELTHERYYKLLLSPNRDVRRNASMAYNEGYINYLNTLGATLGASVNDDWFYTQARKYKTSLEQAIDGDNISVSVFDNLINTVDANLAPLHKWTSIRKRALGLKEIHPYDLSVPLVPEAMQEIPYDSAVASIKVALKPMGDNYLSDLERGFDSGWIDVYETQGKQSGGYNWGSYSTHPYVLLNYNGTMDSYFTVAHEMGHAMHTYYTHKTQPYIYGDYSTFVAEVASTTNEALLIKYLLDHTTDRKKKMYLLNYYIDQIIGTFYTQVMFSEFEKAIHDEVEQGGALSAESMRKIYRDIYKKYWGPELIMDEWNDIGGLRIPHFYNSYYVFQYATSYAAAQEISQRLAKGDTQTQQAYLKLLTLGGSMYPVDELKTVNVDLTTPEPVNNTIKLFSDLVDQMDALLKEK
jgi:oligoendopeptidase F